MGYRFLERIRGLCGVVLMEDGKAKVDKNHK